MVDSNSFFFFSFSFDAANVPQPVAGQPEEVPRRRPRLLRRLRAQRSHESGAESARGLRPAGRVPEHLRRPLAPSHFVRERRRTLRPHRAGNISFLSLEQNIQTSFKKYLFPQLLLVVRNLVEFYFEIFEKFFPGLDEPEPHSSGIEFAAKTVPALQ